MLLLPVDEVTDIDLGTNEKTFEQLDHAAAKAIHVLEARNRELKNSLSTASKAENEINRLDNRGGIFSEDEEILKSGNAPQDLKALSKEEKQNAKDIKKLEDDIKKLDIKNNSQKELQRLENRGGIYNNPSVPTGGNAPGDLARQTKKLEEIIDSRAKVITDQLKDNIFGDGIGIDTAVNLLAIGKNPAGFMVKTMKSFAPLFAPLIGLFAAYEVTKQVLEAIKKIDDFYKKFFDKVNNRIDSFNTLDEQASIRAGLTQRIITTSSGSKEPRYSYNTLNEFDTNRLEHENNFQLTNTGGV